MRPTRNLGAAGVSRVIRLNGDNISGAGSGDATRQLDRIELARRGRHGEAGRILEIVRAERDIGSEVSNTLIPEIGLGLGGVRRKQQRSPQTQRKQVSFDRLKRAARK